MDNKIKNKVDRNKAKAEMFLENDMKVVVKTFNKDYYFCKILLVGEINLRVDNFAGQRIGTKDTINWFDIFDITEYQEDYNSQKNMAGWPNGQGTLPHQEGGAGSIPAPATDESGDRE